MEQETRLMLEQDVINGFSYSFTKALLEKLLILKASNRIFKEELPGEKSSVDYITDIAHSVISYLISQVETTFSVSCTMSLDEINDLIKTTQEFLAIFEEKE